MPNKRPTTTTPDERGEGDELHQGVKRGERMTTATGTPLGDQPVLDPRDALRAIGAFRLALPKTILRYAGGREITLGDLGTRDGLLGGVNAVIVGNYLTTLGRSPQDDLNLLTELKMPVKALSAAL